MAGTTPAATDSFFGVIDSISGNLTNQLDALSGSLANGSSHLALDIVLLMMAAEIVLALFLAMTDSGQKAVSQGIQAFLYTAFIYGLINTGAWASIIIPLTKSFPAEVISALGIPGDSNSVKANVATEFSRIIMNIMDPGMIQPSKSMQLPASAVP